MIQINANLVALHPDELIKVTGGAEFSEDVFRFFGWVVGGIGAMTESWINHLAQVEERGFTPKL